MKFLYCVCLNNFKIKKAALQRTKKKKLDKDKTTVTLIRKRAVFEVIQYKSSNCISYADTCAGSDS